MGSADFSLVFVSWCMGVESAKLRSAEFDLVIFSLQELLCAESPEFSATRRWRAIELMGGTTGGLGREVDSREKYARTSKFGSKRGEKREHRSSLESIL